MTRWAIRLTIVAILTLGLAPLVLAQDGSTTPAAISVTVALAPLAAAATAIERILEWFFNWVESLYQGVVVATLGGVIGWFRWARDEWQAAYEGLSNAAAELRTLRGQPQPDQDQVKAWLQKTKEFEAQMMAAETRLQGVTKTPQYVHIKQGVAVLAGLVLGLVIAFAADLRMFAMLGVQMVPALAFWDHLITGLVIGTGSQPVHSLINLLQQSQDAMGSLRNMWQRQGEYYRGQAVGGAPPPTMTIAATGENLSSPDYRTFQKQGL
jgi:hypothetical protein